MAQNCIPTAFTIGKLPLTPILVNSGEREILSNEAYDYMSTFLVDSMWIQLN